MRDVADTASIYQISTKSKGEFLDPSRVDLPLSRLGRANLTLITFVTPSSSSGPWNGRQRENYGMIHPPCWHDGSSPASTYFFTTRPGKDQHYHQPNIAIMSDNEENKEDSTKKEAAGKSYEDRVKAVNVISHPLASKKSTKKAHKLVKKAASQKQIRRGVKEVIKGIRKGETGLALLAGDIYPLDVISHIPLLLEEKDIPYLFVPSKQDLGAAASTKRPTSVVLVRTPKKDFDGKDLYDALTKEAQDYDPTTVSR